MQDNLIKREIQCSSEQLVSLVCAAGQNISCKVERSVRNCRGTQTIASKVMLKSIPWHECPGSAYCQSQMVLGARGRLRFKQGNVPL